MRLMRRKHAAKEASRPAFVMKGVPRRQSTKASKGKGPMSKSKPWGKERPPKGGKWWQKECRKEPMAKGQLGKAIGLGKGKWGRPSERSYNFVKIKEKKNIF